MNDETKTIGSDVDRLLDEHSALRKQLPNSWNAFFTRFGTLRPIQLAAIPPILAGKNALVMAPTAGGKTEAIAAPVCERIATNGWLNTSAVIITPTRALVNDLYLRLMVACAEMRIRLGRKTADHGLAGGVPAQLLITTPESLESLLTFRRRFLADLRVVIMDEIHLLDGGPRGDQLRLLLGRLRRFLSHSRPNDSHTLQSIASSATVYDPKRVAAAYLGPDAAIVATGGQRDIEARIVLAGGDDQLRAEAAVEAASGFPDVQKVLVFVNSRRQVDTGAAHFRCKAFSKLPVYGHHGSLSKAEREKVEYRFKQEPRAICVATMTLEVGIDIGDVDLVICVDPPFSLASFLQRIGRGCRRMQERTRVICVARDRASQLLFEGFMFQSRLGMPHVPMAPVRRSVMLQQILAYLRQVDKHRRTVDQFLAVFTSDARPCVSSEFVREVVWDAVGSDLVSESNTIVVPGRGGWDFIESNRIYSNIAAAGGDIALVDVDTGTTVAFVKSVESSGVRIAGHSFDVLPGRRARSRNVRRCGSHDASPKYRTSQLPYAADVGAAVAAYLGIRREEVVIVELPDRLVVLTWLGRLYNAALATHLKKLGKLKGASAFALLLQNVEPNGVLPLLVHTVERISNENPLGQIAVETIADVGPYFAHLGESQRMKAREDWLDTVFLNQWAARLATARLIDEASPLGSDLIALADASRRF